MGAAFLLLETRGVTSLSLLFGSTWVVNSVVFAGILTTVLLANFAVDRIGLKDERPWFIPLLLSLVVLWATPVGALNALPTLARGVLGGLVGVEPPRSSGWGLPGIFVDVDRPARSRAARGLVLWACNGFTSLGRGPRAGTGFLDVTHLVAEGARVERTVPVRTGVPS